MNRVICDKCAKSFSSTSSLKKHNRRDHLNEPPTDKIPAQCPICQKWYTSQSNLYMHIRNIHTDTDVEHRCPTCGFVSTTAKALRKHILNIHHAVRRHKCNLCGKAFKRPQDIRVS